jgi:hypothetical protein
MNFVEFYKIRITPIRDGNSTPCQHFRTVQQHLSLQEGSHVKLDARSCFVPFGMSPNEQSDCSLLCLRIRLTMKIWLSVMLHVAAAG